MTEKERKFQREITRQVLRETSRQLQRKKSWSKVPCCLGKLHPKKTCPASFSECNKCSKIGHWAKACSKPGKVFEVAEEEKSSFLGEIVDVCEVQSNPTKSPWIATVLVDKKTDNFKLDSGAYVTVIPYNTFLTLN